MRHVLYLIFMCFAIQGYSLETGSQPSKLDFHALIEPPMPMSQELPITLSQANRRAYIDNPLLLKEEAAENVDLIKSRAFPWLPIISALAVTLVIAFSRWLPARPVKYETDPLIKEKNETQIKKELQRLSESIPKDAQESGTFITRLDFLLRRYLLNRYGFPAFSFTAQELDQEIGTHKDIVKDVRDGMAETFRAADQIKFARQMPSQDEFQRLIEKTKKLLSDAERQNA